jgi:hypothetical protein
MLSGCARGGGSPMAAPISASLSSSTVVVARDGTPTHVQIIIRSTSETALVSFTGMPTNVQAGYQASDTNPSGLLTFMATGKVTAGTYMSIITVNSAGQTTMVTFTVVVPAG